MSRKEELREELAALNVEVSNRWGVNRLEEELEKVLHGELNDEPEVGTEQENIESEEIPEDVSMKVRSLVANIVSIGLVSIPSFGEIELDDKQLSDERTMRRVKHAIKIGMIKEV